MIVGWATTKGKGRTDGPARAFVGFGGVMMDPNGLVASGTALPCADRINNVGQILAQGGNGSVLLRPSDQ